MLLRKSVKKIIQETLEQEISDYLGRDYFERNPEAKTGYRNGYEPKTIKTAEGKVMIDVPQLRDTEESYRSSFLSQIKSMTPELERLAIEMYVRGRRHAISKILSKTKMVKTSLAKTVSVKLQRPFLRSMNVFVVATFLAMTLSTYSLMAFMKVCV